MSYDQVAVTIPADATSFRAGISPVLDSDLWVCRTVADAQGHYFIASGANNVGEICPNVVVFGCAESVELAAAPLAGQTILVRVYNWLDGPTCHGYFEIS